MSGPLLADVASPPPLLGVFVLPLILIALAILGAILIVRRVRRKKALEEAAKATQLPPAGAAALPAATTRIVLPAQVVALSETETKAAAERHAREQRAREEAQAAQAAADAAKRALEGARDSADRLAAQAQSDKLAREAEEARRRAEYEGKKAGEAEEKRRRALEAEGKAAAEAAQKAELARQAAQAKAAELAAQQKLVAQESGRTLSEGLAKTRGGFMARLNALLGTGKELDDAALGELEEILFSADVGVKTATALLESVRERLKRKELADLSKVKAALREEIERILAMGSTMGEAGHGGLPALKAGVPGPQVVMVVGVNGTGKTTTIGKLASKLVAAGSKVLLGAGDTFRAAAGEQLDVWAERAGVPVVRGKDQSDPGAVLFDAVTRARSEGFDIVLCDTAGRLHTKSGLMDELKRLRRTIEKAHAGAPQEVLLVVDATTGQNAIAQARQFHEALGVTGFVLTKLDGTAKGGVIIGICDELKIPVRYVGVGEKAADLKAFDPHEFVAALFE